jgi:hypothetical protein
MIQNGLNTKDIKDTNTNTNSFKIFSINHNNRIKPITWDEKKDSVGIILKNSCKIKNPIMNVDTYSVVLSSNGMPTTNIYNMKLMKVLIQRCNIIGDIPEFIECHIRLNKRDSEGNSSIINYIYNMKLSYNTLKTHSSNYVGYVYHNEVQQNNESYTIDNISIDNNLIVNVNLRSSINSHTFLRTLNRCYEVSGMSISNIGTNTPSNYILYSLTLNVNDINDISKLKGLTKISVEHINFSKYVATDLKLYTTEQIKSFEKWLTMEDKSIYNIVCKFNDGKYELLIQTLIPLDKFNFMKIPANYPVQQWVLSNKMDTIPIGYYGVIYFPELDNRLCMELEY